MVNTKSKSSELENFFKCLKKKNIYDKCTPEFTEYLKTVNDSLKKKFLIDEIPKLDEIHKDVKVKNLPCNKYSILIEFCQVSGEYQNPKNLKKCSKFFFKSKQCLFNEIDSDLGKIYETCWKREIENAKTKEDFQKVDEKCDTF